MLSKHDGYQIIEHQNPSDKDDQREMQCSTGKTTNLFVQARREATIWSPVAAVEAR